MFCFLVCRLVRQVLGGMPAAEATRVLSESPTAVLKAFLRERGVMQGGALVGLDDFRRVRARLERQTFAVEPNTTRAAVRALVEGVLRWRQGDAAWAERLFAWAEAKRRGSKAMDGVDAEAKPCTRRGMLQKERAHVIEVLGREWIV